MKKSTQQKVLDYLKGYIKRHDYPPTLAEVAEGIGVQSRSLISKHIHALAEGGYIDLVPGKYRQIRLKATAQAQIPILGRIAAGAPIEALSAHDPADVMDLLGSNHQSMFALQVKGDSMVEEGIYEGDLVLCEQRHTAHDGDIVVALIDNNDATLKRFYKQKNGTVSLVPANIALKPQIYEAHRVQIQGIFKGLLRLRQ